jgi:hypothetical protein
MTPAQAKAAAKQAAAHDLFDEVGLTMRGEGIDCPSCGQLLPTDAVLCVSCGYNFKLKRRIKTLGTTSAPVLREDEKKPLSETEKMLVRAEDELEHEPVRQDLGYGSKTGAFVLALIMIAVAAGTIIGLVSFFHYMEGKEEEEDKETSAVVRPPPFLLAEQFSRRFSLLEAGLPPAPLAADDDC